MCLGSRQILHHLAKFGGLKPYMYKVKDVIRAYNYKISVGDHKYLFFNRMHFPLRCIS